MNKFKVFLLPFLLISASADAGTTSFRRMSENVIVASSGFSNLISTLCWLIGIGFAISGCVRLYKAWRRGRDAPDFRRLKEKAMFRLFVGLGFFAYPFVQQAYTPSYTYGGYYGNRYYGSPSYGYVYTPPGPEDHMRLLAAVCWYFAMMAFLFSNLALAKAQQLKDDPAAAALKDKAAFCLLTGFTLTVLPFACASFLGVELW
ncbi:MAG: hypothetical protein EPN97_02365 [Alphaproteobacteria bacterium]|nr:MAG: hypothetical protein EPN97_02365 [Alphaproteobacteria bacterium]